MELIMKIKTLATLIVSTTLALSISCTKKSDEGSGSSGGSAGAAASNNINISAVGETMAYDQTSLNVKAGSQVTLTFKNPSTTQKHNWALVKPGKENDVALAGIQAGEAKNFIPEGNPDMIAHTKLVPPGGSDTVVFTAPAPGDYPYECTFPGHNAMMKGVLKSVQ